MKSKIYMALFAAAMLCTGCDDFLDSQKPQGVLDLEQVMDPSNVDKLVVSAYACWISAEDINSSFSMWNFDVRSDDAYKGGNGTEDGDVFHALEVSQGVMTTAWNISDMWQRLYNCISRANTALQVLEGMDSRTYPLRDTRVAEMRFLRAHGHFLLKRLYKNIPFVVDCNLTREQYEQLSNTEFSNNEGWQLIADDFQFAVDNLPEHQTQVGRPTRSAARAYLAKTYLYKAYRQDNPASHAVTEINAEDLKRVVELTDPSLMSAAGFGLESDFHNNFRPEPQYENGCESLWAMQYSFNDGTSNGNCNWSYGLIVPNIPGATDGGCDFYKPSQNLVNTFRTGEDGMPAQANATDYNPASDYADPRLFLTVGIPGLPYMFNPKYMIERSSVWSRSNGLYGYNVSLKHNVDPDGGYLVKGAWWGSPMNRIVLRYADVVLMRAEALALLGQNTAEVVELINSLRVRAAASTSAIANYEQLYGVRMRVKPYNGTAYTQDQLLEMVKRERRLEMAMESERFFDLVRRGEAAQVINEYYALEARKCAIYAEAHFTADKNEYLPIPHSQMSASNGKYTQNIGNW